MDRRNVDISSYCTVNAGSRFILGLHCSFDAAADAFAVNAEAARSGDMARPEPFRRVARYWLADDELRAGRSKNFTDTVTRQGLADAIKLLYSRAASRADVEDIELEHMDTEYRTPVLRNGLLVYMPYTTYAHWHLLRQLLDGAGVERVQVHFDIDSMSRAAFLCSFLEAIQAGRAHGFYVKYSKHFTIDQRRRIVAESRSRRAAERAALPPEDRDDVDLIMMKRLLGDGQPARQVERRLVRAPKPDDERAAQGDVLADAGRPPGPRHEGADVLGRGPRPRRQCFPDDLAADQSLRAVARDVEQPEHGLAGLPAVQPGHDRQVPHYLPDRGELHQRRHGRQDAGDAPRAREAAAHLRGHPVAEGDGAAAAACPPERQTAQRATAGAAYQGPYVGSSNAGHGPAAVNIHTDRSSRSVPHAR